MEVEFIEVSELGRFELVHDGDSIFSLARVRARLNGKSPSKLAGRVLSALHEYTQDPTSLKLHKLPRAKRGTAFQQKVWEQCLKIPSGQRLSYGDLARAIKQPAAQRAVAGALGSNPWILVVPCHRVVRGDGQIGGYSSLGGTQSKAELLARELRLA
jgi:O-6-methylguanine DNA methyltransferase